MPRVVVVGAGPAGLAAAATAGQAGADVLVLEERSETGGQLRYRLLPVAPMPGVAAERPSVLAERLLVAAAGAGAEIRTDALVAGCFPDSVEMVVESRRARQMTADALIVATGSTDLPYPFAGATFPGVFSARGLQILLNVHRVRPGARFAVIGGGDEAEEVIGDIELAGGEVVWGGIAPAPFLRAVGADGMTGLVVGQDRYEVDAIAIAVGRQPDSALAAMAGVPIAFAGALGGPAPVVDDRLQSSVPRLFVAGDAAGVGSVAAAIEEGRLAGMAAAHALGLIRDDMLAAVTGTRGPEVVWRTGVRASLHPVFAQPDE